MHVVRLGPGATAVAVDLRAALAACGPGPARLGGVALVGPPGVEAVLVLPAGVVVVVGVDLPDPALRVDAPLDAPWSLDGWVLRRPDGAVNPVPEARAAAAALDRRLGAARPPGTALGTVVAIGPFAERVVQPPADLDRGVRVLHPTAESLAGAVPAGGRPVDVDRAAALVAALGAPAVAPETLTAEGFRPVVPAPPPPAASRDRTGLVWAAGGAAAALLLTAAVAAAQPDAAPPGAPPPSPAPPP